MIQKAELCWKGEPSRAVAKDRVFVIGWKPSSCRMQQASVIPSFPTDSFPGWLSFRNSFVSDGFFFIYRRNPGHISLRAGRSVCFISFYSLSNFFTPTGFSRYRHILSQRNWPTMNKQRRKFISYIQFAQADLVGQIFFLIFFFLLWTLRALTGFHVPTIFPRGSKFPHVHGVIQASFVTFAMPNKPRSRDEATEGLHIALMWVLLGVYGFATYAQDTGRHWLEKSNL